MPDEQLDDEPAARQFLEIRKPGAHLEEGVIADDFVLMLGVDLNNFPKFARVDDNVTYAKGDARHSPATRRRLRRRAPRLQRPVPRRPALHRLLHARRSRPKFVPWSERYLQLVRRRVGRRGGEALRRRADGGDRVGGVERPSRSRARAHAQRVPACDHRRTRTRTSASPSRTAPVRESCTPDCSHRDPTWSTSTKSSSSRGCSGATSTCCNASKPGPRRSRFATDSTSCSTSSGRSGAKRCCRESSNSRPSTSASQATPSKTG